LIAIGEDIRETRLRAGMTMRELSAAAGVSVTQLSLIERGLAPHTAYETLALIGAEIGLDISIRAFPNGLPVRDAAQLELLRRLRMALPASVRIRFEVALAIPGDLRAWDAVIEGAGWSRPIEAETRIRDVQALQRRVRIKSRDADLSGVILLVADTRHNRGVLRMHADAFAEQFPASPRELLATLRAGGAPPRGGVLIL
jgi:transcriptional regulator with XRE-family HTH domain